MSRGLWLDTHIHVSNIAPGGQVRRRMLEDLLEVLDRSDADLRFVISCDTPWPQKMRTDAQALHDGNRMICDLVRGAPGRLYGSCTVNPHFLDQSLRIMETCFGEWGFVQLGEMLQYAMNYKMNSGPVERMVRMAVEVGVPVQVHVSTSNRMDGPSSFGLEQLEDLFGLVQRVPEAHYILAHAVGMPDADPPVVDKYLEAVEGEFGRFPEIFWVEIRDFNSPGVASVIERVPSTHLLAGTDWTTRVGPPFLPYGMIFGAERAEDNPYTPNVASMVGFLRDAGATEEAISQIAFRNAASLYSLGA